MRLGKAQGASLGPAERGRGACGQAAVRVVQVEVAEVAEVAEVEAHGCVEEEEGVLRTSWVLEDSGAGGVGGGYLEHPRRWLGASSGPIARPRS